MKITNTTTKNIFGSIHKTPGQNLMTALTGCEQQIGIPPYNYGEMDKVLGEALDTIEYDIFCRGYGINRPRQKQCEIAVDLGMKDSAVSARAHVGINKLRKAPYKRKLEALMPSATDLFDEKEKLRAEIERLRTEAPSVKELKAAKYRQEATERKLNEVKAENERLTNQISGLTDGMDRLTRLLKRSRTEALDLKRKMVDLDKKVVFEKSRGEVAKNAFDSLPGTILQNVTGAIGNVAIKAIEDAVAKAIEDTTSKAKANLVSELGAITIVTGLEGLGLPDTVLEKLRLIQIDSIDALCSLTERSLTKMVGRNNTMTIVDKLRQNGLQLRVG